MNNLEKEMNELKTQFKKMEKAYLRLRNILLVLIIIFCGLFFLNLKDNTKKIITAQEFQLINQKGDVRAKLYFSDKEEPLLVFYNNSKEEIKLGIWGDFRDSSPELVLVHDARTLEIRAHGIYMSDSSSDKDFRLFLQPLYEFGAGIYYNDKTRGKSYYVPFEENNK